MKPLNDIGSMEDIMILRLEDSARLIDEAIELYQHSKQKKLPFNSSINRSYYALFKAIYAIHALDGHRFRKHKEAISLFNRDYIHTGKFPKEYGREIHKSELRRNSSDYDDMYKATAEEAANQIHFATEFLQAVKEYCSKRVNQNVDNIIKNKHEDTQGKQ